MEKKIVVIVIALIIGISGLIWYRAGKVSVSTPLDTIIIGTNTEFPPFSFIDEGQITGFDIDVIKEVLKRLHKKYIFKDMPFDALIPEIQLGNIHVIAGGITPTKERAETNLFTKPHLTGNPLVLISRKDNPIENFSDLKGKIVVVNEGYVADSYASNFANIEILRLSSAFVSDCMLALENSRADAFITATYPLNSYFEKYDRNKFNIHTIPNTEESSAFAISKYYPELLDYVQNVLDKMEADGTLETIKRKWGLA